MRSAAAPSPMPPSSSAPPAAPAFPPSSSSSEDWYSGAVAPPSAPKPPSSGGASGFYSAGTTGAAPSAAAAPTGVQFYGTGSGGNSTAGQYGGAYGAAPSATDAGAGGNDSFFDGTGFSSGGKYVGGSSSHGGSDTAYGGSSGAVPPAHAFGSDALSGSMSGGIGSAPSPAVFDPNAAAAALASKTSSGPSSGPSSLSAMNAMSPAAAAGVDENYDDEPPLLEELGVHFPHIYAKSRAVLFPVGKHAKSLEADVMEDADLAGPLAFALALGGELLLSGKMHFGYVYGFGVSGCIAMTVVLNLMSPHGAVSMWTVVSILGYALLPVNLLAGINSLVRVANLGTAGMILSVLVILWCTMASTRLFERGCGMRDQRFLVAYPAALLYSAFVMITIF